MNVNEFREYFESGLVFGCEQLGGYEWGDLDIAEVENAVVEAVHSGVGVFDTADCYGKGLSEQRLGRILRSHRSKVLLATKFGVRLSGNSVRYDSSPEWAVAALHESLKRLQTDHIDLFQMHYWDKTTNLDDVVCQLEKLCDVGKIRAYGFTNITELPSEWMRTSRFQTMSLEYSLANRTQESTARQFGESHFLFLSYGSLGQGVLTGKYDGMINFSANDRRSRSEYKNFHGMKLENNIRIVHALKKWSYRLDVGVPKLALKWIAKAIPNAVPIVGIKNVQQLTGVLGLAETGLPDEVFEDLDRVSCAKL